MAETAKSEQPQTNGLENGLDEDERSKMRPADIDADVKEMERRKRVEMIMSSKLFREELERIIELQLKDGNGPAGLLQQISDMMGIQSGKLHTTHMFRGSNCVTPINDIRGVESMGYEKGEKNLRCKLASVFRLMDLYGWSQGINNQITARLNQDEEHFLVNPHGMLFNEITASSLVKVDMQGNIVEPGTTNFSVNTQGFLLHSAIHASRPDVNCVIHIKTPSVLAVSSLKCGLLPICQEALVIGEVSQHPFVSGIFEPEEREKIIRNLGPHNKVLLLHNHGAVCCGATVEEAFYNVYNTVLACETQMKLMPIGVENLLLVSDETRKQVYDAAHRAPDAGTSGDKKKFRVGEMEFEALIRMLDNAGFRTGYIYRHPLVKGELPKPKNDVEVPPAVSSLGYLIEQEELYKQGNWKKYIDGRNRLDRTKWLNSPNVYQKVEILETGTSDPKKITKWVDQNSEEWVAESSPTHSSTPVKIESALQFVPKGTNPKEFKKLQQQIKENRRADKITSGPQSHILEGVSWEEAKKLQDANITQTGDQVILVGAASKGIIQRNYQHNALVYKTPYAKNPFDSMSDKEIEDYKQLVERKQRGDTDYEESQSESEAISSSRQDGLRHFKSPLLSPQSATSETEEESRDEPRVLRIETKTAPRPIQAEVVLSDGESDTTDARVERSHSARFPKAEKPECVTLMNSFRKSWSLKREKDKSKDMDSIYDSRNLHFLKEGDLDRTESLHCYVARVKQLTHKPIIVDVGTKPLRPLLKSASDPCNLSNLNDENTSEVDNRQSGVSLDVTTSLSSIKTTELQQRLNVRKKLLHSAKMKFLGYSNREGEVDDNNAKSPMRVLISEIRDTINEIMSPERSKISDDECFDSMRWINRSRFGTRSNESNFKSKGSFDDLRSKVSMSKSLTSLTSETFADFKSEFHVLKMDLENNERSDTSNCNCAIHGGNLPESTVQENPNDVREEKQPPVENIVTEVVTFVNASDDEATYTVTEDSLLPTYSFTESTETEWYYNKTIMKLENSQTMLEIRDNDKCENMEMPVKYVDTGIDTDFTSDKEVENKAKEPPVEEQKEPEVLETTEDIDNDAPVCESSGLNKSSETDSSFLKSSSGRTSNDVDTSFAFKTETETSDKTPEKGSNRGVEEKKKFLEEMLLKTKEPIKEESSDSEETNIPEKKELEVISSKLEKILESPEFTNVSTEDAPVTSSSKDTSPEILPTTEHLEETGRDEPKVDIEEEVENVKAEHKRKKNVKTATKITVKKETKEKNSNEPVVSEIKLTIKNLNKCQSEKYEVKIQDVTNTSEELSRSVSSAGENVDGYESFEIVDKSCDCDAQQNLEELQGEVSSTIEKLQTIENYFEDEIKKHSNVSPEKRRNGSDEFTIEYNYREFEEVLNESRSKTAILEKDIPDIRTNTEFYVSSQLGEICGEIEMCDGDVFEGDNTERGMKNNVKNLAMSSAFVAALLSEAVLGADEQVSESLVNGPVGTEVELICDIEVPDVANFEVVPEEECEDGMGKVEQLQEVDQLEIVETKHTDCQELENKQTNHCSQQMIDVPIDQLEIEEKQLPKETQSEHSGDENADRQESQPSNQTQEEIYDGYNQELHLQQSEDIEALENAKDQFCQQLDLQQEIQCEELKEVTGNQDYQQEFNQVNYEKQQIEDDKIKQDCQLQVVEKDVNHETKNHQQQEIKEAEDWNTLDQLQTREDDKINQDCQQKLVEGKLNLQESKEFQSVCITETQSQPMEYDKTNQDYQQKLVEEKLDQQETQNCQPQESEVSESCSKTKTQRQTVENEAKNQHCQPILNQPEETNQLNIQEYQQSDLLLESEITIQNCERVETNQEHTLDNLNHNFLPDEHPECETYQYCQQMFDEENYNQAEVLKPFEHGLDDILNNNIPQSEEWEDEPTYQSCQSRFDFGKEDQLEDTDLQEETVLWNKEDCLRFEIREVDQPGDVNTDAQVVNEKPNQGCQLITEEAIDEIQELQLTVNMNRSCLEVVDKVETIGGNKVIENPPEGAADNQMEYEEKTETLQNDAEARETENETRNMQEVDANGNLAEIPLEGAADGSIMPNEDIKELGSESVDLPEDVQECQLIKESSDLPEVDSTKSNESPKTPLEDAADIEVVEVDINRKNLTENPLEGATNGENLPDINKEFENEPRDNPENIQESQEIKESNNLPEVDPKTGNEPSETSQGCVVSTTNLETQKETVKPHPQVNHILNCLLTTVFENNKPNSTSVNDVINFIVTNEESPTDSLTEFEDMENIISTSSSVVADIIDSIESQMEGEVESLPDEEEIKETDKKKSKKDAMFKVTIATPAKKEIFINYSLDQSSTFNTTSDLDQIEELCNSYIKTDDVNEDFDNLSDFYSIESSGKNSLNSSFCSVEESAKTGEQFCCVGCENVPKSPRSLAIIQEVDEGDSSASSDVVAS